MNAHDFLQRIIVLSLFLTLGACAGGEGYNESAPPGTRIITIAAAHTKEVVSGVYVHDGHYDRAMMEKFSRLFRDRTTGEVSPVDPKLIEVIYSLLSALALPVDTRVELTSGFRSPGRQAAMAQRDENFARRSLHTTGQAADLKIPGVKGNAIGEIAKTLQDGGVAYYPKTGHIHVDVGKVRTWVPK